VLWQHVLCESMLLRVTNCCCASCASLRSTAQDAQQQLVTLSNILSHNTTCCHSTLLVQRS